jgi:DNA repair exonuclease SbcCD ATPase subunit
VDQLSTYKDFLNKTKARKALLTEQIEAKQSEMVAISSVLEKLAKVQDIFNTTGALAQSEVKDLLEKLVTESLQFVFGSEYTFEVETTIARNQPEMEFYICKNGGKFNLRDDTEGGGVLDVVSFVLRILLWAVSTKRTDPVFIFDEPLRHLDGRRARLMGEMIQKLSEMLNLQMILVSHSSHLIEAADKVFEVTKNAEGVSIVREING